MKNIAITLIAVLTVLTSCAKPPTNGYKKFYREYRDAPHTITFKIPAGLAGIFIDKEDEEAKEFMKSMDDISFFVAENASKEMIIDLNKHLPEKDYKEMMVIRDGDAEIIFLAKGNGNVIEEILMTVVDDNELVVMAMFGEFTKETAKKLAKSINTSNAIKFRN
ncbi:MAG: DUF4252 domain-containing protein [Salinivirgaceae bacterium]|jgi:phosphomannomutase|nr:DUF4252 domain-containing protein [Salinivirgaceae bacterium]